MPPRFLALALVLLSSSAYAAGRPTVRTWSGAGADANWSTAANWGGTAPASGDYLVFPAGAARTTNVDDIAGLSTGSLTVADGYTISSKTAAYVLTLTDVATFTPDTKGIITSLPIALSAATVTLTNSTTSSVTLGSTISLPTGSKLTLAGPGNFVLTQVISGPGAVAVTGTGTVLLSGSNTYSGATTVSSGLLSVVNTNALGAASAGTTVSGTGSISVGSSAIPSEPLTLTTTTAPALLFAASFDDGWAGPITLGADSTFGNTTGYNIDIKGAIGETGGARKLTLSGGTMSFHVASSYSGGTDIALAGALQLSSSGSVGSGPVTIESGSGILLVGGITLANPLQINGPGWEATDAALWSSAGANTWSGTITLNTANASVGVDTNTTSPPSLSLLGALIGSGGLTKMGSGPLTLHASSSYAGATTITGGTLATATAINGIPDGSIVTQSAGTTLSLGGNETIGALAGAGTVVLGSWTLTTSAVGGSDSYAGAIIGTGSLVVGGTVVQTLTGASSYNGTSTVNGSLIVSGGTLASTSTVTVANDGVLGLTNSGQVGPVLVNAGGTLFPGDVGPTTTGSAQSVTFNSAGKLQLSLDGTGSATSHLAVVHAATLGSATLAVSFAHPPTVGQSFAVIDAGSIAGTFGNLAQGGTISVGQVQLTGTYTATALTLQVTSAPTIDMAMAPAVDMAKAPVDLAMPIDLASQDAAAVHDLAGVDLAQSTVDLSMPDMAQGIVDMAAAVDAGQPSVDMSLRPHSAPHSGCSTSGEGTSSAAVLWVLLAAGALLARRRRLT